MRFHLVPSGSMSDRGNSVAGSATEARLQACYEDGRAHPYHYIVVSGGRLFPGQQYADSYLMVEWLLERNVARQCILQDCRSVDTFENIRFSMPLMQQALMSSYPGRSFPNYIEIVISSERNHIRRFAWAFFWINLWRGAHRLLFGRRRGNLPVHLITIRCGPKLGLRSVLVEWAYFLLVHVPDPLGVYHPAALLLRARRRARARVKVM